MKRRQYSRIKSISFGACLRKWRTDAHLTLKDAAKRLGLECRCAEAYLSMIERGSRCMPERLLMNVPNVYNVPKEQVFDMAYSPQKTFLATINRPSTLPKPFYDYIDRLDKQDKDDLIIYAEFLVSRKHITK